MSLIETKRNLWEPLGSKTPTRSVPFAICKSICYIEINKTMASEQQADDDATAADVLLERLQQAQDWEAFTVLLSQHPHEAQRMVNPARGWTRLHQLCDIGSTPARVIALVARLYPAAVTMPDTRYGDVSEEG